MADQVIIGDDGNNVLFGAEGNDTISGLGGDDLIAGRLGDDLIDGGAGYDRAGYYHINEALGGVTVNLNITGPQNTGAQGWDVLTGIEYVSGTPFADTLTGDANDNILWGSAATIDPDSDWVSTANNDTLNGGDGNDLLVVGIGNHSLTGGDGIDTVAFTENWGDDPAIRISLALQGAPQDTGQGLWTLDGIENLSGGDDNDELTGDDNDNVLAGSFGNDTLRGGGGNDSLYGDGAIDSGAPASGPPTLFTDVGANADDTLEGGEGNDLIDGGGGLDTTSYEHAAGAVQVVLYNDNSGNGDSTGADGEDALVSIENVTGSAYADTITGNGLANVLIGGDGNDFLQARGGDDSVYGGEGNDYLGGGTGNDYLDGGDGYDRASFANGSTGPVTVDLRLQGTAQDTGLGIDTLLNIENVNGTAFGDTLTGDDGDNWLWGGTDAAGITDTIDGQGGNDLIEVGAGDHSLAGGAGVDTMLFNPFAPGSIGGIISLALQGAAQNTGSGMMILNGFENLSGSVLGDTLTGDGNNNVLAGSEGGDSLSGGGGNDTLYGDGAILTEGSPSGPITTYADVATLGGIDGNDTLDGGDGDDQLYGGGGNDTASYQSAAGDVQVFLYNGGFGEAFGAAGYDQLHDIENLTGSAFNDSLAGNSLNNVLNGDAGNDALAGGGGNDELHAGSGNDFLNGGFGNDVIDGGDGFDRAAYFGGSTTGVTVDLRLQGIAQNVGEQGFDTLINIEGVSGTTFADTLTGDDNANWLWGSIGGAGGTNNDTLDGQGGNDLLSVGIGNHSLTGGSGVDTIGFTENGGAEPNLTISLALQGAAQATGAGNWTINGVENLSGGIGNDALTGDVGNNVLAGNSGSDALTGGAGNDTLYGDGLIWADSRPTGGSGPITTFTDATQFNPSAIDGNDTLEGGLGDDLIDGGGGSDTASYEHASGAVTVGLNATGGFASGADGNDSLVSIENVTGSAFNDFLTGNGGANVLTGGDGHDTLRGNGGDDSLYGGLGDDFLYGNAGNDLIDGGDGFDRAGFFSGATTGVHVDLNLQGTAQDTGQGLDTLIGIEHATGTAFSDTLIGDGGHNWLGGQSDGAGAADTISGNGGDDFITDGFGDHILDGGSGIDFFGFTTQQPTGGLTISLALQGAAQNTGAGMMTLTNFEGLSGSAANDVLTGDGGGNWLMGDQGNDSLFGGAGNDQLYGDGTVGPDTHGTGGSGPILLTFDIATVGGVAGNDLLEGGLGLDRIDGGGGIDTASYEHAPGSVTVTLNNNTTGNGSASGADGNDLLFGIENIIGSAFDDTITGSAAGNVLTGGGGNDFLQARGGDDTLYGGTGNDYLGGGTGNDYLDGGDGWDRASFSNGSTGPVTVDLRLQGAAQSTGLGMDVLIGIEHVTGTAFGDTLIGDNGANWLWGATDQAGVVDTIDGQGGDDLISVGAGDHVLTGGAGVDTMSYDPFAEGSVGGTISLALQGAAQNTGGGMMTLNGFENLSGSGFDDNFTGDGVANVLAGASGNDSLSGGAGDDILYGDGLVGTSGSPSGQITTYADVSALGGIDGNDTLEGGLGNDTLDGGGGNDTASYVHASGGVTVDLSAGAASGADGSDTLANIENVTGSAYNDTLLGNTADNVLTGGTGIDILLGREGNDTLLAGDGDDYLAGGAGNDTLDGGADSDRAAYTIGATAGVTVDLRIQGVAQNTVGAGSDTLISIEHVSGTIFNDTLTGNGGNNWIWGGSNGSGVTGNDNIDGGDGDDLVEVGTGSHTLAGGNGNDTLSLWGHGLDISSTGVAFSLALQGAGQNTRQGTMNATGFENVSGSRYDDALTGDLNANTLLGDSGNDTLVGGAGNDILYGDGRVVADFVLPGGAFSLYGDVERDLGSANGVDGNDLLEGGIGNDTIDGGGGTDTASYAHASGAVTVTLTATGGSSSGADGSDTLFSIENLTGSAFNDTLTGNAGANVIDGGAGVDTIQGGGGDDTLIGGDGADVLDGGTGVNTVDYSGSSAAVSVNLQNGRGTGGAAAGDTISNVQNVIGSAFADNLVGTNGVNRLDGGAGNDTLNGGGGADVLIGGAGSDTFVFKAVTDIGTGAFTDSILDFNAGGANAGSRVDLIDLSLIDANTKTANKDEAFSFLGTSAFSGKAGELRYDGAGHLLGDTNGDGVADFSLAITYTGTLDASDFLL